MKKYFFTLIFVIIAFNKLFSVNFNMRMTTGTSFFKRDNISYNPGFNLSTGLDCKIYNNLFIEYRIDFSYFSVHKPNKFYPYTINTIPFEAKSMTSSRTGGLKYVNR
ncbi:MAG: hypothetical protein K8S23_11685 [Candidatus Cloacimonetes bacterium]|nr:hypothetical protein [Candidatus Cloacimonadota bacterium]